MTAGIGTSDFKHVMGMRVHRGQQLGSSIFKDNLQLES